MAGLVPAIHENHRRGLAAASTPGFDRRVRGAWVAGTSPAMTM
jgi:hypothetical protein